MILTKESISTKRREYLDSLNQAKSDANSLQTKVIALKGAIEDCDYWLAQLDIAEPTNDTSEA